MLYYYSLFSVFAIICYLIVIDKNVADYIVLQIKFLGVQLKRAWWLINFHPKNPISRWNFERRIQKMTRQLEKDLNLDTKDLTNRKD